MNSYAFSCSRLFRRDRKIAKRRHPGPGGGSFFPPGCIFDIFAASIIPHSPCFFIRPRGTTEPFLRSPGPGPPAGEHPQCLFPSSTQYQKRRMHVGILQLIFSKSIKLNLNSELRITGSFIRQLFYYPDTLSVSVFLSCFCCPFGDEACL